MRADAREAVVPAGEDLVDVGLMAGVPDELIPWGIEDVMKRHGQLGDAQAGAEVAPFLRDDVDVARAHLVDHAAEGLRLEAAQGRGIGDLVEQ